MGKRYHCDFCDKTFQDNLQSRRRHLRGLGHQQRRQQWYAAYRDAATILAEESGKVACRKFQNTGRCDFGQSCRFSHLNSEELQRLRDTVEDESGGYRGDADGPAPSLLQEWLQGHERRSGTRVDLPAGFPPPDQLPPSLRPPPLGGWPSEPLTQWG
ncbi:zinc finger matrin-type protein 5 [Lampetra fluviatilis]